MALELGHGIDQERKAGRRLAFGRTIFAPRHNHCQQGCHRAKLYLERGRSYPFKRYHPQTHARQKETRNNYNSCGVFLNVGRTSDWGMRPAR